MEDFRQYLDRSGRTITNLGFVSCFTNRYMLDLLTLEAFQNVQNIYLAYLSGESPLERLTEILEKLTMPKVEETTGRDVIQVGYLPHLQYFEGNSGSELDASASVAAVQLAMRNTVDSREMKTMVSIHRVPRDQGVVKSLIYPDPLSIQPGVVDIVY
jgi:hypothetical protein